MENKIIHLSGLKIPNYSIYFLLNQKTCNTKEVHYVL